MRHVAMLLMPAAAMLSVAAAHAADQAIDSVTCRAGTVTVVGQEDKTIVFALDHKGVQVTTDPAHPFNGATQHCVGVVANFNGKISGNGWCKNVTAKNGDWVLLDWTASEKPGVGTFSFRHGTGAFKGITGGGTYEQTGQTRPIQAGTYQNCVKGKGSMKTPG